MELLIAVAALVRSVPLRTSSELTARTCIVARERAGSSS